MKQLEKGQPFSIKTSLAKLNHKTGGELMLPDGRYVITVIKRIKYAGNADVEISGRCIRKPNQEERRRAALNQAATD